MRKVIVVSWLGIEVWLGIEGGACRAISRRFASCRVGSLRRIVGIRSMRIN